ncbi:hypothetical protein BCV69DRAFT_285752 [Microstroma glucosiphilum]|uniref:Uncharacterized protein n=1 Tax=Pseudomicrostroma glucosiphilum TaxID=1684307 RepID=A0A316TX44_9BASI|nr:hypothetical protein BCV69DRAFT_285752 [Pseudomicrostroma glucosiphilum]PWN17877.1 hypothetical protein BCV69DRAFT_285752 [Pseudomicrostroma glucosiphilum]
MTDRTTWLVAGLTGILETDVHPASGRVQKDMRQAPWRCRAVKPKCESKRGILRGSKCNRDLLEKGSRDYDIIRSQMSHTVTVSVTFEENSLTLKPFCYLSQSDPTSTPQCDPIDIPTLRFSRLCKALLESRLTHSIHFGLKELSLPSRPFFPRGLDLCNWLKRASRYRSLFAKSIVRSKACCELLPSISVDWTYIDDHVVSVFPTNA